MHQYIPAHIHTHTDTCVFIPMLNEANYNKMKDTINFILYILFLENKLLLQRTPQLYSRTSKSQSVSILDVSSHWLVIIPQHFDIALWCHRWRREISTDNSLKHLWILFATLHLMWPMVQECDNGTTVWWWLWRNQALMIGFVGHY